MASHIAHAQGPRVLTLACLSDHEAPSNCYEPPPPLTGYASAGESQRLFHGLLSDKTSHSNVTESMVVTFRPVGSY